VFEVIAQDSAGARFAHALDKIPDSCPACHRGIKPINLEWNHLSLEGRRIEKVYICPLDSCNRLFLGRYFRNPQSGYFFLRECVPAELQDHTQPAELQKISPDFCAIYNQANKAERLGLLLISGPGYRKALEFLVKDYLTSLQTTDEAKKEIANGTLMSVLKKYATDKRMLTTAERAAWLGNDETHYVRKWEDKDLQDMKNLIQLTCYWIQSEHLTNDAAVTMPQGKK
jgi:hypothetical protein